MLIDSVRIILYGLEDNIFMHKTIFKDLWNPKYRKCRTRNFIFVSLSERSKDEAYSWHEAAEEFVFC